MHQRDQTWYFRGMTTKSILHFHTICNKNVKHQKEKFQESNQIFQCHSFHSINFKKPMSNKDLPSSLRDKHPRNLETRIKTRRDSKRNPKGFHLSPIAWWTKCSSTGGGSNSNYIRWQPRSYDNYYTKSPGFLIRATPFHYNAQKPENHKFQFFLSFSVFVPHLQIKQTNTKKTQTKF